MQNATKRWNSHFFQQWLVLLEIDFLQTFGGGFINRHMENKRYHNSRNEDPELNAKMKIIQNL